MHFVHIEDFFHPDAGYQLNLLSRLQVKHGHQVTIVTSELKKIPSYVTKFFGTRSISEKDEKFQKLTGVNIIRIPLLGYYSGRSIYHPKIFKIVDALKPDVLFVHGEDTMIGIQYIWNASKLLFPIVLDCHMLEMASVNKFRKLFRLFYRNFITPIILKREIPLIRVVDSDYVEKCLGIPLKRTILLSFGTDTDFFNSNENVRKDFKIKNNIHENDFVVLYAGKLDKHKGGLFLAESIKENFLLKTNSKIVFIIIGNTDGEYGANVEKILESSENKILRFPTQTYIDLATFYQSADLAIYPRQCSMSFFEAQSCKLPVVFEENEINSSRVMYGNGFTFIPDNLNDFRDKIIKCAEMDANDYNKIKENSRKYIVENFNYIPIAKKFTEVMVGEVNKISQNKNN